MVTIAVVYIDFDVRISKKTAFYYSNLLQYHPEHESLKDILQDELAMIQLQNQSYTSWVRNKI